MARAKAYSNRTGESLSGYFRRKFLERPDLLRDTSIKTVMDLYFEDHPNDTQDLGRVKQAAYNAKTLLRGRRRKRKAKKAQAAQAPQEVADAGAPVATGPTELETLEEQIDECLALAKSLDAATLGNVILNLRLARNGVVLKQGQ